MLRNRITFAVGLSFALAVSAHAQNPVNVYLSAPNAPPTNQTGAVTAFGYYMSPYAGTVDGTTERLNCVDFFHDVMIGESWKAIQVNLGAAMNDKTGTLIGYTRDGSNGVMSTGQALSTYEQVAWLTAQMPANPASNADVSTAIQTAIWYLASYADDGTPYASTQDFWDYGPAFTNQPVVDGAGSTGYWVNLASTEYSKYDASYYSNFNILTDANINKNCVNDPSKLYTCTAQEFVYSSTPEPATLTLFATGLAAVVGRARRRRKSITDDAIADPIGA